MATYSERIKELRRNRNMSQQDLADRLDVNKVTVSQYERGVRRPNIDVVSALCDIFNVSTDYLLGEDDVTLRFVNGEGLKKLDTIKRIPVLGRVAAGIPIEAIEDVIDWEDITEDAPGEYFGLRIKGDSMSPRIMEGDTVIVHAQSDAESGDVVIVQINGDTATCKRLMKHGTGISLISFNPAYAPMTYTNDEIQALPVSIIGKVVENRQRF